MRAQDQDQSKALAQLCSMIIQILKSPSLPIPYPTASSSTQPAGGAHRVSPTAFASLFIGISLALMLFGSVTFVIGFILMPWVFGLVLLFYFAGIVSHLSEFGKSIFCTPPRQQYVPEWSYS